MKAMRIESSLNQNEEIKIEYGFKIQKEANLELYRSLSKYRISKSNKKINIIKSNLKLSPICIFTDSNETG